MAVRTFPNKYAARCQTCGQQVGIAEGLTRKGNEDQGEPKWVTTHNDCPQEAPEAITQPASTQTESASAGRLPTSRPSASTMSTRSQFSPASSRADNPAATSAASTD